MQKPCIGGAHFRSGFRQGGHGKHRLRTVAIVPIGLYHLFHSVKQMKHIHCGSKLLHWKRFDIPPGENLRRAVGGKFVNVQTLVRGRILCRSAGDAKCVGTFTTVNSRPTGVPFAGHRPPCSKRSPPQTEEGDIALPAANQSRLQNAARPKAVMMVPAIRLTHCIPCSSNRLRKMATPVLSASHHKADPRNTPETSNPAAR